MKRKINIMYFSILIAALNIFDGWATHYGLEKKQIEEFNPLMDFLWFTNPLLFLSIKFSLSLIILLISYFIYIKSEEKFQQFFSMALMGMLGLYVGVCSIHLYWLSLL